VLPSPTDRPLGCFSSPLTDLRLLQLADSALPIGAMAHSFGLESLVAENLLVVSNLESFLEGWLTEAGAMDAVFCNRALGLAREHPNSIPVERWVEISSLLSARKMARESRNGSILIGRNFLATVAALHDIPALGHLLAAIKHGSEPCRNATHYCLAFGLVAGLLGFDESRAILTYLHQSVAGMVSSCQRLMPLGQTDAARILWNLKPHVIDTAERCAAFSCDTVTCFMPLLEWGAMQHPALSTRLFVS
jgi:urease accessory protein